MADAGDGRAELRQSALSAWLSLLASSGTASVLMLAGGVLQWRNRTAPCPLDPQLRAACLRTRRWSQVVYAVSLLLLAIGAAVAFVLPALMGSGAD
jgi:hypothetical protein